MLAAIIPLGLLTTLPAVEAVQRAGELIFTELPSLVRAPQLPADAITMLIDMGARATPQCWIALVYFHGPLPVLPPSAQACAMVHRCAQSRSMG
ncbi:MAG: hypothetical protein JOZ65_00820 [Chloroflexi bacterium]|nr:hypothetical protein [Chloroflexota bacterium]